jgi:MFS family permease
LLGQERQAWLVVAVLFAALAFIFGGTIATPGIFFASLIKQFGWSHARVSMLASSVTLGTIPGSVAVGFLLERVDTRIPMVAGAAVTAGSLLFASHADSYLPLLITYFFAGFGVAMATLLPATLVVANWFQAKRGIAMGVAIAGVSAGGMIMVQVAAMAIRTGGWRTAYAALALPILLIVIPLVLLVVRTRPPDAFIQGLTSETGPGADGHARSLEGFNLATAARARSFWLIAIAGFVFAFTVYGILTQLVVYLLGVGYRPGVAAMALSVTLGLNAPGKVLFGFAADRIGARLALALSFAIIASGIILLIGSRETIGLALFLVVYGPAWGAPLMLLPLITIESLGLKHYPSLGGILRVAEAVGAMLGPVALGRIFDLTSSYRPAFGLCIVCAVVGAAATLGCEEFNSASLIANKIFSTAVNGSPIGVPSAGDDLPRTSQRS